ncbi:MAG: hypothetical protein F4Y47_20940 [Acidobacteriia bacterium]|nr:hypothetical protein [Terriglobia bacterium]MYK10728.1 hypothetical protein [Terriglobia bacterium]
MIRRIAKGARGHPGNAPLAIVILFGFLAGLERSAARGVAGALAMLAVFGFVWLLGAYERGRPDEPLPLA